MRDNPTGKNNRTMAGPCLNPAKGAVRVWATARSEDFAEGGGVQAASSAIDGTGPPIVSARNAAPAVQCSAVRRSAFSTPSLVLMMGEVVSSSALCVGGWPAGQARWFPSSRDGAKRLRPSEAR